MGVVIAQIHNSEGKTLLFSNNFNILVHLNIAIQSHVRLIL